MNELMIHVEKIVRPVRAFAPRKLRMRRELLAHLQAALDEERGRDANELTAMERAKARLGQPTEMTNGLQESVPWGERMLMAKLPIPRVLERMEEGGGRWWRLDWPMTMTQAMMVFGGAAILPLFSLMGFASLLKLDRQAALLDVVERRLINVLFLNIATTALIVAMMTISFRFIISVASLAKPLQSRAAKGYACGIILVPVAIMLAMLACLNRRTPTSSEFLLSVGVGFFLLISQALIARVVATMRRPYAEWLSLEVPA